MDECTQATCIRRMSVSSRMVHPELSPSSRHRNIQASTAKLSNTSSHHSLCLLWYLLYSPRHTVTLPGTSGTITTLFSAVCLRYSHNPPLTKHYGAVIAYFYLPLSQPLSLSSPYPNFSPTRSVTKSAHFAPITQRRLAERR